VADARLWNTVCVDQARRHNDRIAHYWDTVASRYLDLFRSELEGKPFDVALLKSFAAQLGAGAYVCDAGCGPCGHVTALLASQGLKVHGIDISPECVKLAQREHPSLTFDVMDQSKMTFAYGAFDGLVTYYSLHYQPKACLDRSLREFCRVLRPGGRILVVSKEGDQEGWIADPLGSGQETYWSAVPIDELAAHLERSGFRILDCQIRDPLPDEIPVRRIFTQAERIAT